MMCLVKNNSGGLPSLAKRTIQDGNRLDYKPIISAAILPTGIRPCQPLPNLPADTKSVVAQRLQ
jgi:hypothetical protein